jgi:hypothetical protein
MLKCVCILTTRQPVPIRQRRLSIEKSVCVHNGEPTSYVPVLPSKAGNRRGHNSMSMPIVKTRICNRCLFKMPTNTWFCRTCGNQSYSEFEISRPLSNWKYRGKLALSFTSKLAVCLMHEAEKLGRKVEGSSRAFSQRHARRKTT